MENCHGDAAAGVRVKCSFPCRVFPYFFEAENDDSLNESYAHNDRILLRIVQFVMNCRCFVIQNFFAWCSRHKESTVTNKTLNPNTQLYFCCVCREVRPLLVAVAGTRWTLFISFLNRAISESLSCTLPQRDSESHAAPPRTVVALAWAGCVRSCQLLVSAAGPPRDPPEDVVLGPVWPLRPTIYRGFFRLFSSHRDLATLPRWIDQRTVSCNYT